MSKIPSRARGPPRSGGLPRPSNYKGTSASSVANPSGSQVAPGRVAKKAAEPPKPVSLMPPLSVLKGALAKRTGKDKTEIEKSKKKMIRRNIPKGEDLKTIRQTLKGLVKQEITVHEFVGLLAPYTGDNGTLLRTILAAELSSFRKLAKKIYDTMTQDVSDVLTNEHIQLTETMKEKHALYSDKMMRAIDEIYEYCPNFDFQKYYSDPDYLESLFPLPKPPDLSGEQEQLQLRQEAYHRMMWLRSEGDRLGQENKKLQSRLREIKRRQQEEMNNAKAKEHEAQQKRQQLEDAQEDLQDKLEDMNKSIEKTMVEQEKSFREQDDVMPPVIHREPKKAPKPRVRRTEKWNIKAAKDIEDKTTKETLGAETSRVSVASSKSSVASTKVAKGKKSATAKSRARFKRPPQQEGSPFHYSPPKSPPRQQQPQQRQTSPFHYSPPKTPPMRQQQSPSRSSPPLQTTRVTTSSTTVEQGPARPLPQARRGHAPRDTWGGFG